MSNAINAASLGAAASSMPYQLQSPYSLLPQSPNSPPMSNITSVLPNVNNGMPNLIPERMPSYSNSTLSGSISTALPKNPSPIQTSFRNLPHHSSPAIDYRQPSPPGEKMGKEDDFNQHCRSTSHFSMSFPASIPPLVHRGFTLSLGQFGYV